MSALPRKSARATLIRVRKRKPPSNARGLVRAAELTRTLRAAGLRRTAPRIAVLERLEDAATPLTHADIAEALAPIGFDRATVYRNLTDLVEAGLVTRADLGDHVWRFELLGTKGRAHAVEHAHFLCTDCGDVACLPDAAVKVVAVRGAPRSLAEASVEVQLKGLCDACAR
jgi:Fur family ferric uptake transcriptional regulator